jgi:hypothetical protein
LSEKRGALIPADGSLPLQGIAPTLIPWTGGVHPTATLPESGCALVRLEGLHPEAKKVISVLESIGFEGDFRVSGLPPDRTPYLVAHIQTPAGVRQLWYEIAFDAENEKGLHRCKP